MLSSTLRLKGFTALLLLTGILFQGLASAKPTVGVAPLQYKIPSVGRGISEIISEELAAGGRFNVVDGERLKGLLGRRKVNPQTWYNTKTRSMTQLSENIDLLLTGKVRVFDVVDKDSMPDYGSGLRDFGALFGGNSEVAHVAFDISLIDTASGEEVFSLYCEGFESRRGVRTGRVTFGNAATFNFRSDEFRETQLGRSTYKALGVFLEALYQDYPLEGTVVGVADDAIVVELGAESGLEPGDELALFSRRKIVNSAGEAVWVSDQRIGGASVLEFQDGRCLCLLLDGFGIVQEGDIAIPLVDRYLLPVEADKVFE